MDSEYPAESAQARLSYVIKNTLLAADTLDRLAGYFLEEIATSEKGASYFCLADIRAVIRTLQQVVQQLPLALRSARERVYIRESIFKDEPKSYSVPGSHNCIVEQPLINFAVLSQAVGHLVPSLRTICRRLRAIHRHLEDPQYSEQVRAPLPDGLESVQRSLHESHLELLDILILLQKFNSATLRGVIANGG